MGSRELCEQVLDAADVRVGGERVVERTWRTALHAIRARQMHLHQLVFSTHGVPGGYAARR